MFRTTVLAILASFAFAFAQPVAAEDPPAESAPAGKPIFVSMVPHFTVNLGISRFLNLTAETHVGDEDTKESLTEHMPAVRHTILMMLADLKPEDLATARQKEIVRRDLSRAIRKTLRDLGGENNIKGFYITSMVIQ
ncbi:MAG: flagellar basal body-associated FliL family protein [Pseudomonadota bacterium]